MSTNVCDLICVTVENLPNRTEISSLYRHSKLLDSCLVRHLFIFWGFQLCCIVY